MFEKELVGCRDRRCVCAVCMHLCTCVRETEREAERECVCGRECMRERECGRSREIQRESEIETDLNV